MTAPTRPDPLSDAVRQAMTDAGCERAVLAHHQACARHSSLWTTGDECPAIANAVRAGWDAAIVEAARVIGEAQALVEQFENESPAEDTGAYLAGVGGLAVAAVHAVRALGGAR